MALVELYKMEYECGGSRRSVEMVDLSPAKLILQNARMSLIYFGDLWGSILRFWLPQAYMLDT